MFKFSCAYNQSKEKIVQNLSDVMASRGGVLKGNLEKGEFSFGKALGKFSGRYALTQTDIVIEFTQKPVYFSAQYIQQVATIYFQRQLVGTTAPQAAPDTVTQAHEDFEFASL